MELLVPAALAGTRNLTRGVAGKVQGVLQRYRSSIIRLALRPEKPSLYLRVYLRLMQQVNANELFTALRELAG